MMGTSLLAIQVALEEWREGVNEAPIEGCDNVKNISIVWLNIQIAITKGNADIHGRVFRH